MLGVLQESSTRIKTGIVLIAIVLLIGIIDSFFIIWLFLGVVMFFGLGEAMNLFKVESKILYFVAILTWIVAYFYPSPHDLVFLSFVIFGSILAYTKSFSKLLFLPLLYPLASYLFLLSLYSSFGIGSLLWLLVVVAGADIGAYFVGKTVGKTQFCPTSPKKTLEGVIGGIFVATLLGALFAPDYGFWIVLFVSFAVAVGSVFGDLFESYLKREADIKDSGTILPGHGGVLDRTDGYLFGGIVMYILLGLLVQTTL